MAYNLVHIVKALGFEDLDVIRNDQMAVGDAGQYDAIILSPGPGIPSEAGIMPELVKQFSPTKKILGVCLGHQCIAESFGGKLFNLPKPVHGKATAITVLDGGEAIYRNLPSKFQVGRYHSWVAEKASFPDVLKITALTEDGHIMSFRHKELDVTGVQYHPESVLTENGAAILENWLKGGAI